MAMPQIQRCLSLRVPGSAIFLASSAEHVPPVLIHHVERSRSLHETVVLLNIQEVTAPVVSEESRYQVSTLGDGFYRLLIFFGYMEEPLLLPVLHAISKAGRIPVDPDNATYYIGRETIVARDGGLNRVPEAVFSYLNRNAVQEERRYGMPTQQIVEIGTQVQL